MSDKVQFSLEGKVGVIRLDDGKANAFGPDTIDGLRGALEQAKKEAGAVLLVGRPGRFSAGFDLNVMRSGADTSRKMLTAGAEMLLDIYGHPQPTVAACTGHALALGALVLLSCDTRIGAEGEFKIGLNETSIGMGLPIFGTEIARDRLSKRHLQRSVIQAEIYTPATSVDAGFLDRVCADADLLSEAQAEAARLAELPGTAYADAKRRMRQATIDHIRATLEADLSNAGSPS